MKTILFALLFLPALALANTQVEVLGLFKNAALLKINGQQVLLKAGKQGPNKVTLISSTPKQVVLDINGHRQTLGLSQRISGQYSEVDEKQEVAIPQNAARQYITYATLNGRRQQVLIDTGANSVAMNSQHAKQLGVDYQAGEATHVGTASGVAEAYRVKLRSVSVGGIQASGVEAVVIEGRFPHMILLGMTYLQHVDLREQNGTLFLQAKF